MAARAARHADEGRAAASYISTAAKHGQNVITVIRDALAGNPWMHGPGKFDVPAQLMPTGPV
ncbi:MAG TPA: hypothetical protein VH589_06775 [Trebonia sp.]|jgi:hypothetical protein